jgi:hypothetical protein
MPWLRHFALFVVFVAALFRPAAAGAFVSAPDAGPQVRVGAFELVAATLVGPASGATCGLHEGIGRAYDENASGYRFAARGIAPSSRALGQALEAAGHVRPASSAAHHIVAGNAPAAAQARAVLQRFGIGINDAANGVFLPATRAAPNAAGAAVHSTVHTNAYYQTVNQMLGAATTRAEAEAALGAIRSALLSGGL